MHGNLLYLFLQGTWFKCLFLTWPFPAKSCWILRDATGAQHTTATTANYHMQKVYSAKL